MKEEEKEEDKEDDEQALESEGWAVFKADGVEFQINLKEKLEKMRKDKDAKQDAEKEDDEDVERYFIGESGPPPPKPDHYSKFYLYVLFTLFVFLIVVPKKSWKKMHRCLWMNSFHVHPLEDANMFPYKKISDE